MQLNAPQKQAVTHLGSPALVLAGAGSGKTGVITRRIAWLINDQRVDPRNIFAVTFTNKAAREMRERVLRLLGTASSPDITLSTFHSLGLSIIRAEADNLGLTRNFSIMDPADGVVVLRDLLQREFNQDGSQAESVVQAISMIKNQGGACAQTHDQLPLMKVYEAYQRYLRACNAIDLDDCIALPRELLSKQSDALNRWRQKIHYLLVDEYQDTNASQYDLVKLLAGSGSGLMVVGDDDQSIYAWRGAKPENLFELSQDFPDLKRITLDQNYRSMGRILNVANHLIRNNPRSFEKTLWSDWGYGDPVKIYSCENEIREAEKVVTEIMSQRFQHRSSYGDFAVLYRSNHQARIIEQKLMEMQIPYRLSGGLSFFDRSEIRDVMAYLKLVANPADDTSLMRVVNTPRRGIGAATLERLAEKALANRQSVAESIHQSHLAGDLGNLAAKSVAEFSRLLMKYQDWVQHSDPVELIDDLLDNIGYRAWLDEQCDSVELADRRWQNVLDLRQWIARVASAAEDDLGEIVRRLCLSDMLDRQRDDDNADQVSLMTLHAAKGLEFDNVFIVGVEEGLLPHQNSQEQDGIEEERRLFYVGITRAKKRLAMTMSATRKRYGETLITEPSRFLDELPPDDLDWRKPNQANEEETRNTSKAHLAGIRDMLKRA